MICRRAVLIAEYPAGPGETRERKRIMARYGFIHDKLEIKFLILYIMSRVTEPVSLSVLTDLTLCDDGIDYFDFAESAAELTETEHLQMTEDSLYAITEKGLKNGKVCESSLPYSVRIKADRRIAALNQRLRRSAAIQTRTIPRENGSYTVALSLNDEVDNILNIELMAASEEHAARLETNFRQNAEQIYNAVLDALLADYPAPERRRES